MPTEIRISKHNALYQASIQLEELDYTKLYRAYSGIRKSQIEPRVLFKVLVCAYIKGVYSSRKIEELCRENLVFRWLLEDQKTPDHCTIARFRGNRNLQEAFEDLFFQYVKKLENKGYVEAAQEEALDTALSNAGFGIQFADVGSESEEYGSEVSVGAKAEIAKPVQVKTELAEPAQKQPEVVKTVQEEPIKANDPLDAIMADDMPVPEQVTAEVVEKPKTVVLESVQPAQTPAEPPQNVIVLEQEPPAAAYTQSSPVEEIRRQMTYEQAQNVIVDCGTCKGWTLAQVADRRPASLRWYVKGYQGENNILRAAAAIIWDSLQEKQAG